MIVEWLVQVATGFLSWLLTLVPPIPSDLVIDSQGNVAGIGTLVGSMSVWVNWVALGWNVATVVGVYFTTLIVRVVWAFFGRS